MVISKGVIDGHVFEEWLDVHIEESLNDAIVKTGVNENSTNVSFNNIWQTLRIKLGVCST